MAADENEYLHEKNAATQIQWKQLWKAFNEIIRYVTTICGFLKSNHPTLKILQLKSIQRGVPVEKFSHPYLQIFQTV